jgi:hypothetical protein
VTEITAGLLNRMKIDPTLASCERTIERALVAYVEAGLALDTIREGRLYREADFDNFEAYVKTRWNWSRAHAYRLIEAANVHEELYDQLRAGPVSPNGDIPPLPRNEAQARELATVADKPAALVEAWQVTVEKHGPEATARQVREVVAEVMPAEKSGKATKSEGYEVKSEWHRQRADKSWVTLQQMAGRLAGIGDAIPGFLDERLDQALAIATGDEVRLIRRELAESIHQLRQLDQRLAEHGRAD